MVGKPRHKHLNKGTRNTQGAQKVFFAFWDEFRGANLKLLSTKTK